MLGVALPFGFATPTFIIEPERSGFCLCMVLEFFVQPHDKVYRPPPSVQQQPCQKTIFRRDLLDIWVLPKIRTLLEKVRQQELLNRGIWVSEICPDRAGEKLRMEGEIVQLVLQRIKTALFAVELTQIVHSGDDLPVALGLGGIRDRTWTDQITVPGLGNIEDLVRKGIEL